VNEWVCVFACFPSTIGVTSPFRRVPSERLVMGSREVAGTSTQLKTITDEPACVVGTDWVRGCRSVRVGKETNHVHPAPL
jgi:hypothetical protein